MAPAPTDFTAICEEFIRIDVERDELKARLEVLDGRRAELQAQVMKEIENGSTFENMKLGGVTVSVATVYWPKWKRSRAELAAALKAHGLGDLVKEDFNQQTLRGYTNEMIRAATEGLTKLQKRVFDVSTAIPEGLREDLSLSPTFEVRTTGRANRQ
jgi:hypothetical protein